MYIQTDLAWAAGFFDGEGTCYFYETVDKRSKDITRHLRIQIGQLEKNRVVLDRFMAITQVGAIVPSRYYGKRGYDPQVIYTVGKFKEIQHIVAILWKYLSPVKRRQMKEALIKYHTHKPRKHKIEMGNLEEEYDINDFKSKI